MFDGEILDVSPDAYHDIEAFSSTVAKAVIGRSPLHAKAAVGKRFSPLLDRGTVLHRLVLGKGKEYVVAQPHESDYRTKNGKAFRDKARAEGLVPVKSDDFISWGTAATRIIEQLAERGVNLDGASELAIGWKERTKDGVVQCKGMLDHVWLDDGRILDLKITENAEASMIERTAENLGYAIQHAAYVRALSALRPELTGRVEFLFAFCEPEEPFAINLCRGDGVFRELGERRWLRAVQQWAKCTATGKWPGYGDGINYLGSPAWALNKEEETAA